MDESLFDDFKIALEERILRIDAPKICLHPSVRVLQVASIVAYNSSQKNIPKLSRFQIARCMRTYAHRQNIIQYGMVSPKRSAAAMGWQQIPCIPRAPPMSPKTSTLLRCANYIEHSQNGITHYSKNVLMNDPVCRQTIFGQSPPTSDSQVSYSRSIFHQMLSRS